MSRKQKATPLAFREWEIAALQKAFPAEVPNLAETLTGLIRRL